MFSIMVSLIGLIKVNFENIHLWISNHIGHWEENINFMLCARCRMEDPSSFHPVSFYRTSMHACFQAV